MAMIIPWITSLIFLLLLLSLVEWLLPNTSYRPYLSLFLGMVLVLFLIKPLSAIFSIQPDKWIEKEIEQFFHHETIEKSYQIQKKEIQASMDAYILEQTRQQMIREVEKELTETFQKEIIAIHFWETNKNNDGVTVILQDFQIQKIDPIIIGPEREATQSYDEKELFAFFQEKWGLAEEQLKIEVKRE